MMESLEVLNEFDFNNFVLVGALSVFILINFINYGESFFASFVDSLLMSSSEKIKRKSLPSIAMMMIFGIFNCASVVDEFLLVLEIFVILVDLILFLVFWLIGIIRKSRDLYNKYKNFLLYVLVVLFFPIAIYVFSSLLNLNLISCSLLCAMIDVMIISFMLNNQEPKKASYKIKICFEDGGNDLEQTWYVFHRREDCMLCGDTTTIDSSHKFMLIKLDTIMDHYFIEKID